jgi:hypothetical protein
MDHSVDIQSLKLRLTKKAYYICGLMMVLFILTPTAATIAFESNTIWLKGQVKLEGYKNLDPRVNIDEFEIKNDEDVTLYITYRAAARDKKKWSKITYQVAVTTPDGQILKGMAPQEEIMGGSGVVPDEHAQDWGISHDSVGLSFSKEDARGTYLAKILIQDHVSGEKITRTTKIHLK